MPVDTSQIFVTGFSNGASMTFRLGVELSDRIAAIAPVAGHYWPTNTAPTRPLPTLFLIGDRDPLVPLAGGRVDTPWGRGIEKPTVRESLRRWSERLGGHEEPTEVRDDDGVTVERFGDWLEAWTVAGLGHHWPGGRGELNSRIAGPPSDRVNATEVIWKFFVAQNRKQL
jgi:polyhydroxybutyrate depolymerase